MSDAQDAIARGLAELRSTAPRGVELGTPDGAQPAAAEGAPAAAAADHEPPGWLAGYVELGLLAAANGLTPADASEAQIAKLATLQSHERAIVDRIEGKLPALPEMNLRTLVLIGAAVIVLPRALAVVKLRKYAAHRAGASGNGIALPPTSAAPGVSAVPAAP